MKGGGGNYLNLATGPFKHMGYVISLFRYLDFAISHLCYLGLTIRPSFSGLRWTGDLEESDRGQGGGQQMPI